MTHASTIGFTWATWSRGAPTSASTPSTASCLPSEGETLTASRPLWSAMCPPPTSGRWKPPWRCPAAATAAPSSTARSLYQEVTSTTPTPGPCARMTPPLTLGRIRTVWAHPEGGTALPPWETEPTSSVAASWEVAGRGWTSSPSNHTTPATGSGATARLFTQEWAQPAFPLWTTRCISSEAGTRARRSTRNAFRFTTLTSMNGLRMMSCQKLQSAFHAALSPSPQGKHESPEPVQCLLHQSVYKGLDDDNNVVYISKCLQLFCCRNPGSKLYQSYLFQD